VPKEEKAGSTRIVLDSNIWVSAFITPLGSIAALTRAIFARRLRGLTSQYILDETGKSLSKKQMRKYGFTALEIRDYLIRISSSTEMAVPAKVKFFVRDLEDLPILGTALVGKADYLVTGDHDLLEDEKLRKWMKDRGVRIVSPKEFHQQTGQALPR
jgi:uncharacterized protein